MNIVKHFLMIVSTLTLVCGCGNTAWERIDECIESGDYYHAKQAAQDLGKKDREKALEKISKAEIAYLVVERNDFVTARQIVEEDNRIESYMVAVMKNLEQICNTNGKDMTLSIISQMPTPYYQEEMDRYNKFVRQYNDYLYAYAVVQNSRGDGQYARNLVEFFKPSAVPYFFETRLDQSEINELKSRFLKSLKVFSINDIRFVPKSDPEKGACMDLCLEYTTSGLEQTSAYICCRFLDANGEPVLSSSGDAWFNEYVFTLYEQATLYGSTTINDLLNNFPALKKPGTKYIQAFVLKGGATKNNWSESDILCRSKAYPFTLSNK